MQGLNSCIALSSQLQHTCTTTVWTGRHVGMLQAQDADSGCIPDEAMQRIKIAMAQYPACDSIVRVLSSMMQRLPADRPTAAELVQLPMFKASR